MTTSKDWKEMVAARLESHDKKLDKLLESVVGLKVKMGVGAGLVALIVSIAVKYW